VYSRMCYWLWVCVGIEGFWQLGRLVSAAKTKCRGFVCGRKGGAILGDFKFSLKS